MHWATYLEELQQQVVNGSVFQTTLERLGERRTGTISDNNIIWVLQISTLDQHVNPDVKEQNLHSSQPCRAPDMAEYAAKSFLGHCVYLESGT